MAAITESRVAIVTGSTKGIGRAIAAALVARGDRVIITSRQKSHAEEVAAELVADGGSAQGLGFDLDDVTQLDQLIEATIDCYGRLDILVNNAISQCCLFPSNDFSDAEVVHAVSVGLTHNYLLCHKAFPYLQEQRGSILNIASAVTHRHMLGLPLYSLVKGGVLNTTKILASEWAAEGVRVNGINPGFIHTQAFNDMGMALDVVAASYRFYGKYQPLGGVGDADAVGLAAAYLTSKEAAFVTGAIVDVDGGYSTQGLALYE